MPFNIHTKTEMFVRCNRQCCLCLKQCGINMEAAHIIAEAEGGSNEFDNGIPLCFDCHQEVGSYNNQHPRGNKIRPEELRARRDRVYQLVASGQLQILPAVALPQLFDRRMELQSASFNIVEPNIAQLTTALESLPSMDEGERFVHLIDHSWQNAYLQTWLREPGCHELEYRDGPTQRHFKTVQPVSLEALKFAFITYTRRDDSMMYALKWEDITQALTRL